MPLIEQYLIDLIAAPVLACMWWSLSRAWAEGVQAGRVSDRTRSRQKGGFLIVLILLYLGMFGMTAYVHFNKR